MMDANRNQSRLSGIEQILLTTTQVSTFQQNVLLTRASGFFFEREGRLFLVTSRHVLYDAASGHAPDRIELVVHEDPANLRTVSLSLLLYDKGTATWRDGRDGGGQVDVAVIELQREVLPASVVLRPFEPRHLLQSLEAVEVGTPLLLVGFPLGFYDTLHSLPVVRHAIVSSAFGLRFQGQGFFLTDARAHRGSSGAPVVMRANGDERLPWKLLGVHSSRMDMVSRDLAQDESLGLNCAWYADILMTLTQ
jgi:S1-C subfamily serine protease